MLEITRRNLGGKSRRARGAFGNAFHAGDDGIGDKLCIQSKATFGTRRGCAKFRQPSSEGEGPIGRRGGDKAGARCFITPPFGILSEMVPKPRCGRRTLRAVQPCAVLTGEERSDLAAQLVPRRSINERTSDAIDHKPNLRERASSVGLSGEGGVPLSIRTLNRLVPVHFR